MGQDLLTKLKRVIEASIKDRYDEGAVISDLLKSAQDEGQRLEAMSYLIQNYDVLEPTGVSVPLTDRKATSDRWKELRRVEGELMDAQVRRAFKGFPTPEEASARLLRSYDSQPDDETRDFFIANLLADSRIPYFGLPSGQEPLKMENDRFDLLNRKLRREIKQIEFIIRYTDYEQHTERASLLMAVLNSIEEFEEQVVLMVHILRVPEEYARRLALRRLQER